MDILKIHSPLGILTIAIFGLSCMSSPLDYNPNSPRQAGRYKTVSCTDPIVQDKNYNAKDLWDYVDGNGAWNDALSAWNAHPIGDFSMSILNFFNAPPVDCGILTSPSTCDVWRTCTDFNYPAGMLIYNQFFIINYINQFAYAQITTTETHMTPIIPHFSDVFAIYLSDNTLMKQIFDLGSMAFSLLASPFFNFVIKEFFAAGSTTYAILKDIVSTEVVQSTTFVKDTTTTGLDNAILNHQTTILLIMGNFINLWSQALVTNTQYLFNGSANSIARLTSMVQDGRYYSVPILPDNTETQNNIEQVTIGLLLPIAWSLSNQFVYPFVMDSGLDCCAPHDSTYTDDAVAAATGHCYNHRMYYLLSLCSDGAQWYSSMTDKYNRSFCSPYGIEDLGGQYYGGLNYGQLIEGSVNSYIANGNQNGWSIPDPTTVAMNFDINGGVTTAGVSGIPMCNGTVAFINWVHIDDGIPPPLNSHGGWDPRTDPTYPCSLRAYGLGMPGW